jgi:hypothetical protein
VAFRLRQWPTMLAKDAAPISKLDIKTAAVAFDDVHWFISKLL